MLKFAAKYDSQRELHLLQWTVVPAKFKYAYDFGKMLNILLEFSSLQFSDDTLFSTFLQMHGIFECHRVPF